MKVEQIIDEMQASLTKLREQMRLTKTAGDVVIDPPIFRGVDMGKHTFTTVESIICDCGKIFVLSEKTDKAKPPPDIPLHARVAKALGMKPSQITGVSNSYWGYQRKGYWLWDLVPDYPNDLVAAMDGGLRYMEIINKNRPVSTLEFRMGIDFYGDSSGTVRIVQPDSLSPDTKNRYELVVHFGKHAQECCEANGMLWAETKTEAICEAIVKHAEGR